MQPSLIGQFVDVMSSTGQMFGKNDVLFTLLDWFEQRKDYTPSFWVSKDENGNHPLLALAQKSTVALDIYDHWKSVCPDLSILSQPNPKGEVLLHEIWKLTQSDRMSYIKDKILKTVEDLQPLTDSKHWTWLDKPEDRPGQGWAREVLKLTSSHSSGTGPLVTINNQIASKFPQKLDPKTWLTVSNVDQVISFQGMGLSLHDDVPFTSHKSMPAWKWFATSKNHYHQNLRHHLAEGKFGEVPSDDVKEFLKTTQQMAYLVPKDHRAKSGYVKSVLGCKTVDASGLTSLNYLLRHRSDLLPMFINMSYGLSKEDLVPLFAKDVAGVSFALRVLLQHPSSYADLKHLAERKQIDFDPQLNKGWALAERDVGMWLRHSADQQSLIAPSKLVSMLSVEELFGSPEDQKRLSQLWDKKLVSFAQGLSVKKSRTQASGMARELMVYALLRPDQRAQLIEPLQSQMNMMIEILARHYPSANNFTPSVEYNLQVRFNRNPSPPSMFTQGMTEVLEKHPEFSNATKQEANEEWRVAAERYHLGLAVAEHQASKNEPSRRLKL